MGKMKKTRHAMNQPKSRRRKENARGLRYAVEKKLAEGI
jgi:hypothetical protein